LENSKTSLETTINDALELGSIDIATTVKFISELTYEKLNIPLERLIEYALLHRPDYKAAQSGLELSEISLRETKESNNLRLSAVGTLARSDSETLSTDSTRKSYSGTLNLAWPFFDSNATKLRVQNSELALDNARISFEQLKRTIKTEVTNAYLQVKRSETQLEDLRKSRKSARQSVKVVQTRYKNGIDRLVDVFNVENDLRNVELEYLNALISANKDKDNLALFIGGSLEDVKP